MAKFVNYKKRSVTLPAGCKDLLDLLQPAKRAATGLEGQPAPEFREERFHRSGLLQVERFIAMLFASSAELFVLMITIRDDRVPIVLHRNRGGGAVVVHPSAEDLDRARAIRGFFRRLGVKPLHDLPVPEAFKSLAYVLRGGISHVAGVIDGLLREPYGLV
jgi:hypothetical protein